MAEVIEGTETVEAARVKVGHVRMKNDGRVKHRNVEAEWQKVQQKTFLNWVNFVLSRCEPPADPIDDLCEGLQDGVVLADLLRVLSKGKFVGKVSRNPKMKLHIICNLNLSLGFLRDQGVALVNIGAVDIYEKNYTIVMGLIWILINTFQVSQGGLTKDQLLKWCNTRAALHGVEATNFTKSWADGTAFAAVIASLHPDFKYRVHEVNPPVERMAAAFSFGAEKLTDVPALLSAEDVVNYPDERSIVTYLSMVYREYKDEPMPQCSCPRVTSYEYELSDASSDVFVSDTLYSCVLREKEGENQKDLELSAEVIDADGNCIPVDCEYLEDGTTKTSFTPLAPGPAVLRIMHGGKVIQSKEIDVQVPFVDLKGPGTKYGIVGQDVVVFPTVLSTQDGGEIKLQENDPRLSYAVVTKSVEVDVTASDGDGGAKATFVPESAVVHSVEVLWRGEVAKELKVPVFGVTLVQTYNEVTGAKNTVLDDENAAQVVVEVPVTFQVLTEGKDRGGAEAVLREELAAVVDTSTDEVKLAPSDDNVDGRAFEYNPTSPTDGILAVRLPHLADPIRQAPLEATLPYVQASGDGLSAAIVSETAEFTVQFRTHAGGRPIPPGDTFSVKVFDSDGNEVPAAVTEKEDHTSHVAYTPDKEGDHRIVISRNGQTVKEYTVPVSDVNIDVVCGGDGMVACSVGQPANVTVQLKNTDGEFVTEHATIVVSAEGGKVPHEMTNATDEQRDFVYTSSEEGELRIRVLYKDKEIFSKAVPCLKLSLTGQSLDDGGQAFGVRFVPCSTALATGSAEAELVSRLENRVTGPDGLVECRSSGKRKDGDQLVSFLPVVSGPHTIGVFLEGVELATLPVDVHDVSLDVRGIAHVCAAKSKQSGSLVFKDKITKAKVEVTDLDVRVTMGEVSVKVTVSEYQEGKRAITFTPKNAGMHTVIVTTCGHVMKELPLQVIRFELQENFSKGTCLNYPASVKIRVFKDELASEKVDPDAISVKLKRGKDAVDTSGWKNVGHSDDGLSYEFTPNEVGDVEMYLTYEGIRIKKLTSKCSLPWCQVEGPASEEAHLGEQNEFYIRQYHPYTKEPLEAQYLIDTEVELLGPMEDEHKNIEYRTLQMKVQGETEEDRKFFFKPQNKGSHLVNISHKGVALDQKNLPHGINVTVTQYDSFVKLYFGDDDAYRKIKLAETYVTVGVNRNSNAKDLVGHMHQKLAGRLSEHNLQAFKADTSQYSIVEISKPDDFPVAGEVEAQVSRKVNSVKLRLRKGINLSLPDSKKEALDPYATVNFAGQSFQTEVYKETNNPNLKQTYTFQLLDNGAIPVTAKGLRERIHVGLWDLGRSGTDAFIGGVDIDIPNEEAKVEEETFPIRRYKDPNRVSKYRKNTKGRKKVSRNITGGSGIRGMFGAASFGGKPKMEETEDGRLMDQNETVWKWSLKGKVEHEKEHGEPIVTILTYKLYMSSFTFDIMYPQKGMSGKEVVIPIICKDPKSKKKVESHGGSLHCRILSPSREKIMCDAVKVEGKLGMYQCKFVPEEGGNYEAVCIFNSALIHGNPAIIKIKGKK